NVTGVQTCALPIFNPNLSFRTDEVLYFSIAYNPFDVLKLIVVFGYITKSLSIFNMNKSKFYFSFIQHSGNTFISGLKIYRNNNQPQQPTGIILHQRVPMIM